MTKPHHPDHLCPVVEHPELEHLDDAGVRTWAEAHDLTLYRDWRGMLCTTLEDAYRLREILDADNVRQAEEDNARRAQLVAESDAAQAPIRRRLEKAAHRLRVIAQLDADGHLDDRYLAWDAQATEKGDALFMTLAPAAEVDTRSPIQRLLARGSEQ